MQADALDCFLLTRQWRDGPDGLELTFWATSERGPVRVQLTGERAVCFVARDAPAELAALGDAATARVTRRALELRDLSGNPVDGLYFRHQRDLNAARDLLKRRGIRVYESDLKPSDRFLMERFVTAGFRLRGEANQRTGYLEYRDPEIKRAETRPAFRLLSIDIETSDLEGDLYSIAASGPDAARVFMVASAPPSDLPAGLDLQCCRDEKHLLMSFFAWLDGVDPDLLIGWNVVNFDLDYLDRKCQQLGVPFALGRGGERSRVLQPQSAGGVRVARVPGRVVLDGIEVLRAGFWSFESFELESVGQALLGRGKQIDAAPDKVEEIRRLYREDKAALARYNLEDCRLVEAIFARADLVRFATRRAEITGLAMERLGGSVAAFDHLYLPRLHRRGRVAPDVGTVGDGQGSPGGYVMDSKPGLFDNVLLLDFKSLYPSIIRTFKIDPFGLAEPGHDPVEGFLGAAFAREGAILPELVAELWQVRDQAKAESDAALSQAVKILMNSLYGVLGAYGCRFFDPRLTTSITRRGHQIIQQSRDFIEERGHPVIYGDTDSLFVHLPGTPSVEASRATGDELAGALNLWWRERIETTYRLESFLEIEFETHYLRFLMPTVRGEQTGSKKRYAGLVQKADGDTEIVFKGLESVRTDWTPIARRFQRELYRRVFNDEPYEAFVRETLEQMLAGERDDELIYRKRVRRALHEYTQNVPPHVQAARKLARPSRWVRYVVTSTGPEPVVEGIPRPDYQHYRDRQLAPAANGILHFLDTSFEAITDAQLAIF